MTPKCPNCGSIIYSRRNVLCGVCGKRLPEELLFTVEEREKVDHELENMDRRGKETRSELREASSDSVSRYVTGPNRRWSDYSVFRWLINRFKN
jgi:hypothetical protein